MKADTIQKAATPKNKVALKLSGKWIKLKYCSGYARDWRRRKRVKTQSTSPTAKNVFHILQRTPRASVLEIIRIFPAEQFTRIGRKFMRERI